jgi:hypothetical protein
VQAQYAKVQKRTALANADILDMQKSDQDPDFGGRGDGADAAAVRRDPNRDVNNVQVKNVDAAIKDLVDRGVPYDRAVTIVHRLERGAKGF